MNRLLVVLASAALGLVAFSCGSPTKQGCTSTGCSAGSVCNTNTGVCELISTSGGGGGTTGGGGGTTGGGGGTTGGGGGGGTTGGGSATGGGGMVVDPFDDGGVFLPGEICSKAISLDFDGGTTTTASADLSMASDEYASSCSSGSGTGADLVFSFTLTEAKGVTITATDTTAAETQDLTVTLVAEPCPSMGGVACKDTGSNPEVLDVARVPAGTWYVLVENYSDSDVAGTIDLQVELRDAVPGPANDACADAQVINLMAGMATVSGTTTGAFNDTSAAALTCSSASRVAGDVFYSFTLTQAQDVRVTVTPTMSSSFSPAVAITTTCGGTGMDEKACDSSTPASAVARNLQPGTYFITVDGDSSSTAGDFDLAVVTTSPTLPPANDTCLAPATLVPNATQTVDANAAPRDYTLCSGGTGGDVVYAFSTTQAQKVTIAATSTNGSDAILALRAAPCDMDTAEVSCVDNASGATETLTVLNLPAGDYFVIVQAYRPNEGTFGVSLTLEPPVLPPSNDSCAMPATLTPNMSQTVDLAGAATDYTVDCAFYSGGDAVYSFDLAAPQRVVITATGMTTGTDAVLELRSGACDPGTSVRCADTGGLGDPESVVANNLPAGTYYVVLANNGVDSQYGISLTVEPPRPILNETCTSPDVVAPLLNVNDSLMRSVDLTDATAELTADCATNADGGDVVYSVTIPAMRTLVVVATPPASSPADPVLAAVTPVCTMTTSEVCVDDGGSNDAETLTVPNTGATAKTVFIVLKEYDATSPGEVDLTFTLQ